MISIPNILKNKLGKANIRVTKIQEYSGIVCMKAIKNNNEIFFAVTPSMIEILVGNADNIQIPTDDLDIAVEKIKIALDQL